MSNTSSRSFDVALVNDWKLSDEHIRQLDGYFLRHWQFEYLIRTAVQDDGTVLCEGNYYVPIFVGNMPSNPQAQVMLSFRIVHDPGHDGFQNYVLIKAA
jgi:hypothetical protein